MRKIFNKFLIKTLFGALMGLAICITIYGFGVYDDVILSNKPFMIAQFIGSAVLGIIGMGGSVVYEVEKWSLTAVTITHYILVVIAFVCCCVFLKWFEIRVLPIVLIIFTITYFIIWLINYLISKNEIKKINEGLEILKQKDIKGDNHE